MTRTFPSAGWSLLTLAVVATLAVAGWNHHLQAQTASVAAPVKAWDYRTLEVDITTLQAELVTLGRDGWDVVTVLRTDQVIDNAPDGRAHLLVNRVQVIAKKPLAK